MRFKIIGILLFIIHTSVHAEDLYGKYKSTSTMGIGLFGGNTIEIDEAGFSHQVFTDYMCSKRTCPELYKPPYVKYRGKYQIEGNKVTFITKHMNENIFYLVKIKDWQMLLPEKAHEIYSKDGVIPSIILAKQ